MELNLVICLLQMLASLKQQYVELLSDIGFIQSGIRQKDVERAARGGLDGVADTTGIEVSASCMFSASICRLLLIIIIFTIII